jgi:oligopeptide transport system substrate-binding protein
MMRKLIPILLGLIAIAAVACGGDDEKDDGATANPTATTVVLSAPAGAGSTSDPTATPPPAPSLAGAATPTQQAAALAGDTPQGGIFRRLWSDPPTLDPHLTSDTTSAFLVVEIHAGLVSLSPDLVLVPDIAERWERSEDGLVYTFYLRPNARFHDGKPITAQDFKWSLERAARPETGSPVADTYLNDIVGAQAVFDGDATEMSGIRVIDDRTLQITIDAPKAYFLAKMTYPTAYVLDRENVESGGRNWFDNPNGAGPFKLKEYRIGERIVLERNDLYHREPANIEAIEMNLAGGQAMAMYENDEIDITGVGLFDLERVSDPSHPLNGELIVAPPDFNVSYIGFNTSMNPFDDAKFRQALNHAINKELIATEVLSGLVVPAYGILPPGFPAYSSSMEGLRYDPELARRLLSESKYADPDSRDRIVVTVPGTGGTIGIDLEVILNMWEDVLGIEVEIQQVEWATYLEDLQDQRFQAFAGLGWEADYPDPQDFLDILFHTESSLNHGGYSNTAVDAILEDARIESDVARRVALYRRAEEMIVADAAWVPLWYQGERHVLIKPHVQNYRITPMIIPKLREVYFEK